MRIENAQLTLGSLFDGIGGFPLAGTQAGIRPVWASEIEPFPIRVVEKRLPHVRHYGDVHHLNGGALEPVDIITFGSPCQDLSIAGKRSGLDGARSGLFHEAVRVIHEMREKTNGRYPRWAVWENVPGALSSLHGRDFREVLEKLIHIKDSEADVPMPPKDQWLPAGEILGDSYSLAWRVLDAAQGWGVAQRRKRVFVVLDLDGQCAGKVLFESEGMSGYSPPRTETRQRTAGSASQSTATTGAGVSEASGFCTEHSANSRGIGFETERSPTLRAGVVPGIAIKAYGISADQSNAMLSDNPHAGIYEADTSRTLDCNGGNPSCNQGGMAVVEPVAFAQNQRDEVRELGGQSGTISASPGIHQQTFIAQPHQPAYCMTTGSFTQLDREKTPPIMARDYKDPPVIGRDNPAYALDRACFTSGENAQYRMNVSPEKAPTLVAEGPSAVAAPEADYLVRRLTPGECCRLQGYPDGWCENLQSENPSDAECDKWQAIFETFRLAIALLNGLDQEIERLLKRKQNGYFSDTDKIRLQELIDTREAIEVKYNLSPADVDGFDTIRRKLEAEIARAQARGLDDASVMVYENAVIAAAEGMAAVNAKIDEQYDKEYALIKLIEDASERQSALDELNARYNQNRYDAAVEYAQTLSSVVMPVWEQENIQQAATDVDLLTQKLREYSTANETERPAILEDINAITAAMDEGSITEYIGLLTQIQSLLDSGMSETEIQAMFPEIDFSAALEQIAAIQSFLNQPNVELPALSTVFGEALPEEALKIATDLDMTGAQARWDEFAANPGAITTEAIISGFQDAENAEAIQPTIEAFISKYTEIPEGADTAELTPEGVVAYVGAYAEATSGVDVSSLTPDHVTAMIAAYKELDTGADISTLKPEEITAYIYQYLEANDVDTSSLKPEAVTAFVMSYEEATGGALTSSLAPGNITAMVTRYLEAENVDLSALSTAQTEAIVTAFAEATNCDKSALLQDFTAYITKYDDSAAERPSFSLSVGISGYDLIAYRQFVANHPVEVQGIVRLGEVYQNPTDVLGDAGASFWQNGQEIPVSAVPTEMLTADKVAVLAEDGTLHVLISPKITGAEEAIAELRTEVEEVDQLGTTVLGNWAGIMPTTTFDLIDSAIERIKTFNEQKGTFWQLWGLGEDGALKTLDASMKSDFNPERVAELSTYVGEVVSAIEQGKTVKQEDLQNLQTILTFLQELDTTEVGSNVLQGVADGMTAAGWDTDAETVAVNLETALNTALGIQSPSERVKPIGGNVSAGVGAEMSGYDFSVDATSTAAALESAMGVALTTTTLATVGQGAAQGLAQAISAYSMAGTGTTVANNVRSAVSSSLTRTTLRSVGVNAMEGLKAGINAGRSGVISAMRSAAKAAVSAAKSELKIKSPSGVFEDEVGVQTMKGFGVGVLKESKEQARIIRNASRFLTEEARESAIGHGMTDNRRTYNQNVSSTVQVAQLVVRDEQDIHSLAVEIAALTRRQQRGRGLRMA